MRTMSKVKNFVDNPFFLLEILVLEGKSFTSSLYLLQIFWGSGILVEANGFSVYFKPGLRFKPRVNLQISLSKQYRVSNPVQI